MIFIFLLCLKLSIISFCVSDRAYECELDLSKNFPLIFLIDDEASGGSPNDFQKSLNDKFKSLCGDYYNIMEGSLKKSRIYKHAIHFALKGYYEGMPLQNNFTYAGNISKIDDAVCTKTDKVTPKYDCNEIANVVSPLIEELDDGNIYDFVQKMDLIFFHVSAWDSDRSSYPYLYFDIDHRESCKPYFSSNRLLELSIVIFCYKSDGNKLKPVNIRPLTLIQIPNDHCQDYLNNTKSVRSGPPVNMDRLIAILAPEPVKLPSEYIVPTIFYETPYMSSEVRAAFPNSMNLMPWRFLKYGIVKFIQTVGWQRVAIVTDDSDYSIEFEEELTALFRKERLVYTVVRCEDAACDMGKVIHDLIRVKASIVVANVEKDNAEYLIHASTRMVWLLRDMFGKLETQNQKVFSFNLHSTISKECKNLEDSILNGLNGIALTYLDTVNWRGDKGKKREYYRRFTKQLKKLTQNTTEATIKVHRLYDSKVISSMSVNEDGAKMSSFIDPYKAGLPLSATDGTTHCLVTSYDFHKPCEDPLLMFIMFILMMFVLTFLLITCYFDKTAPFNMRYQNF